MKKKFLMGATALVAGLALASCGESEKVELNTMSMFGGTDPHAVAYEGFLDEFAKDNKIEINDNSATADEIWKTSVISSFYTGNEPDVLFFFTGNAAKPLVDNKKVVSVADIRKEYPEYGTNVKAEYMDPYAVTLKGFVEGIFVNKDFLKDDLAQYASKDKWTWDEFLAVCDGIKAQGKTPVALGAQDVPHYWIEHLILGTSGKEAYKAIPKAEDLDADKENTKSWVKGLSLMKTLADRGVFGTANGNQKDVDANQSFLSGESAMKLDGSWFAGQIKNDGTTQATHANTMMIPFPAIPAAQGGKNVNAMQSGFTSGFYISKKAWDNPAKRDLAVKLVMKMTSTEAIAKFCKDAGGVPADTSVVVEGLTALQTSMNSMTTRTDASTLPLSDSAKAGSFAELVNGQAAYLGGKEAETKAALRKFFAAQ